MVEKEIYYYNRKYPEYEITKIKVNSEEYIVGKDYKYLNGIYANYDIDILTPSQNEYFISLHTPYEDNDIYVHETTFKSELVFSYNLDTINNWRNADIEFSINQLEKRLKKLKGESNE